MKKVTLTIEHFVRKIASQTKYSERLVREILREYHAALLAGLETADAVRIEKVVMLEPKLSRERLCSDPNTHQLIKVPPRWRIGAKPSDTAIRQLRAKRGKK